MAGFRLMLAAVLLGVYWGGAVKAGGADDDPELAHRCVNGNISWTIFDFNAGDSLFTLRVTGGHYMYGGVVRETSVSSIAEHFGVRTAQDLVGKTFAAPCRKSRDGTFVRYDDPLDVLDLFGIQRMYDGRYVPPTDEVLYRRMVQAFSNMKLPDFSDVDRRTLWTAFERLYDARGEGPLALVDRLARDVFMESKGKVTLSRSRKKDWCGNCQIHLFLISADDEKYPVKIGPYPDPVAIDR